MSHSPGRPAAVSRRALPLLASLAVLAAAGAAAQETPPAAEPQAREVRAVRIDTRPPVIDGRLDEEIWRQAVPATDFRQRTPDEGEPSSERTEVYLLYDADALYVGARMYADSTKVQAPLSRRDDPTQADFLLVSLDPYNDRRTAYSFGVTAAGTRLEWYHPTDSEARIERSFDPVWSARTRVDSAGWTAEMRIPFSQLRFNRHGDQLWGLNIRRSIPGRNEESYWVLVPRTGTGWASRFGTLQGIEGIRPTRRVEMLPYVVSDATVLKDPDPENPFQKRSQAGVRFGGDLKMGFGPNLTLDATINPDFGQVSADPAEVNLTAYETHFAEQRPFFFEGAQLLAGTRPQYFYSRRIGAPPALSPGTDFADTPGATTILGAAKLTGRFPSGMSVGALAAVSDEAFARTYVIDSDSFGRVLVAPRTGFAVARVQQELGASRSTVGLTFTGLRRDLPSGGRGADLLHRSAFTGGADWRLRFRNGVYLVNGWAGFSRVDGDSVALLATQRSSAHFFQRPDASWVRVDAGRTSLSGYTSGLSVEKAAGRLLWYGSANAISPGFELNDAGLLRRADEGRALVDVVYRNTQPGRHLRDWVVGLTSEGAWNFGGVRTFTTAGASASATLNNFWTANLRSYVDLRAQSDELTRGGPLMGTPHFWAVIGSLSNRPGKNLRWNARIYYGESEIGEVTTRVSGGVTLRPAPRLQAAIEPNYLRFLNPRQFIGSRIGGPESTFGRRYIFSYIDFRTLTTQIRLNYVLTPDLSLQLYAEPFASSGRYFGHGELPAAGSRDLRVYGTDGTTAERLETGAIQVTDGDDAFRIGFRDFNVRSLRTNAVMRWEWRPGSTAYLVWQQNGENFVPGGDPLRPTSFFDAVQTRGDNFLAIKVAYWLPLR
jgi:hypothetical protein